MIYGKSITGGVGQGSLFTTNDLDGVNKDELIENYIYDELSRLPDNKRKEFLESAQCVAMQEAGKFRKKTIVRLSKKDDLTRRETMAAMQLAKDNDDILWTKLVKNRVREKELIRAIKNKYSSKSARLAMYGQKEFIKQKVPTGFMRQQ